MKKILFSLYLVLGMGSMAMAQTQAGNIIIGANLGWNNNENTFAETNNTGALGFRTEKGSSFNIEPIIGTFITDNLALGMLINYSNSRGNNTSSTLNNNYIAKTNSYEIGPFIRKFFPLNERFVLYGHGHIGYGHSSIRTEQEFSGLTSNQHEKYNSFMAAIKPGIVFFASKKIGVDLSVQGLQYSIGKEKNLSRTISSLVADFNLPNLNLGLNLYLSR